MTLPKASSKFAPWKWAELAPKGSWSSPKHQVSGATGRARKYDLNLDVYGFSHLKIGPNFSQKEKNEKVFQPAIQAFRGEVMLVLGRVFPHFWGGRKRRFAQCPHFGWGTLPFEHWRAIEKAPWGQRRPLNACCHVEFKNWIWEAPLFWDPK